jgi:hypothetical protein
MCVVCCPGSKAARPASQRSEKRSVRLFLHANSAAPPMGAFTNGAQRSARPTFLTLRWWSETAGCAVKWQKGNRDRRPCSPTAECQTNLVLPVRSGIFPSGGMERQRSVAVGKCPCSRLLLCLAPGEASRCYCWLAGRSLTAILLCLARAEHRGLLLAGRSLAAILLFRARTICP